MIDVYVLTGRTGDILCIATDFERCSMEQSKYSEAEQEDQSIETHPLLEDGD